MKNFLLSTLLILAALVGCKKQPEMASNLLVITAVKSDFDTKATETAFEVGDKIGLFLETEIGNNLKYSTLDGINWSCFSSLNGGFENGKDYYATAYYPYSENAKDATAIEVSSGSDFMIAEKTKLDISGNAASGTLQFKHALSKLAITIDTPEEIDGVKTVSLDSIIVKNVFRKAFVNINESQVEFSNFSDNGDIVVNGGAAIIIPQAVSRIEFVFKMVGGGFSKLAYVKGVALESGNKTTLNAHSNADLYFNSALDLKSGDAQADLPLSIFVATGRAWTLTSSAPWLTFSKTSGIGKGLETITVNVAQNAGTPRTATLTLADDKPSKATTKTMQNYVRTVTIAGTKWTTRNLTGTAQGQTTGFTLAANPQDYGMFWKWGSVYAYNRESNALPSGHWGTIEATSNYGAATQPTTSSRGYDYANASGIMNTGGPAGDPCKALGSNYRTPTQAQIAALVAAGKSAWTTYNGVAGYFFGAKAGSCNNTTIQDGCIFIPAAGYRHCGGGTLNYVGRNAWCWSSSVYDANNGRHLDFGSGGIYPESANPRGYGFSVRCVQE